MSLNGNNYGLFNSNQQAHFSNFDAVKISLAGPEKIREWSRGEVTKPETVNYRSFKPEAGGLFCAKIFGPTKDYECQCGKYKRVKYKGIVCEKCGVEVTSSKVRRERMGHIKLAVPVAHIWFLKSLPSKIATILNLTLREVENVVYFREYMVIDGKMTEFEKGQVISKYEYEDAIKKYGKDAFKAEMGAGGIRKLLEQIDLQKEKERLIKKIKEKRGADNKKFLKQLKVVNSFIESGNRPEWMVLTDLPVLPPDLRPLTVLDDNRPVTSDLNELYRRVINRNNRLKRFIELEEAPDLMIKMEMEMLQRAVDALLYNGKNGNTVYVADTKRPFKSLSDSLKGKTGRFRQNLLGKRVDYSGRSVIVVGPNLKIHQCGIPKKMALELFKPFIFSKLELYGYSASIRQSKRMVEQEAPEVLDVLDEVVKGHPVLLNRAPTLHRLSVQAFEPVLVEGKAIQMHPLVCKGFNADFDGDQMAVHVPLSIESQIEARILMLSTNNILHPKDGKPTIIPEEDMMFGVYYLTMNSNTKNKPTIVSNIEELEYALFNKKISLHDPILYRFIVKDDNGNEISVKQTTTAGKVKLFEILPEVCRIEKVLPLVNKVIFKNDIRSLLDFVYRTSNQTDMCIFADNLMTLSFKVSCGSGLSIGKDDMLVPEYKSIAVKKAKKEINEMRKQFEDGLITDGERYNRTIDIWTECSNDIAKKLVEQVNAETDPTKRNSIYMLIESGARGSKSQIQHLSGMRGLMTNATGRIIETPILSNFKEGLSSSEYFISANLSRKGYVDIALRTANAGYMTRKLVDVAQDVVVVQQDCGTHNGIMLEDKIENGKVVTSLCDRALGRMPSKDILDKSGKVLIKANTLIDEKLAKLIATNNIGQIEVRSALTCECKNGICAKCYGRDLTTGILVSEGEAVGIVAAQAIGEPGTQLTMNTKHLAGAGGTGNESSISAIQDGVISFKNYEVVKDKDNKNVLVKKNCQFILKNENGNVLLMHNVPYGAKVYYKDGDRVKKGDLIAEWDPYNIPVIALYSGKVERKNFIEGKTFKEEIDSDTFASHQIIDYRSKKFKASLLIGDKEYELENGTIVTAGDHAEVGEVIAKISREASKTKDITGGIPRIRKLFEVQSDSAPSIIATIDGIVKIEGDKKKKITITPENNDEESVSYPVSKDKYIFVSDGDKVHRGDALVDGTPVPQDILRILGVSAFAKHMTTEIQKVYELQGINIADKHIEVILSKMLKKVEVIDAGETTLLVGQVMEKEDIDEINEKAVADGLKPAKAIKVLIGITKASLETKSFISAASFQETTKVLTDASIQGKIDELKGLKENIVLGRLIPAGTGLLVNKIINNTDDVMDKKGAK